MKKRGKNFVILVIVVIFVLVILGSQKDNSQTETEKITSRVRYSGEFIYESSGEDFRNTDKYWCFDSCDSSTPGDCELCAC